VSGDGFLDAQEVFLMAREMGYKRLKLKHAKELIAKVDQDKDGKINFEEFKLLRKITKL
jgi:Ca2+-binding EF-hand superfamily protein